MEPREIVPAVPVFTQSEVSEMENLFREVGEAALTKEFCEDIAASFSSSMARAGMPAVSWEQVQRCFQDRQNSSSANVGCLSRDHDSPARGFVSSKVSETAIVLRGARASELADLAFEAKSSRDRAWYDVATFLQYRLLTTGELEARVRFAGFGTSHDEWVNIKKGVRQRSIPLEASECHRARVGDLVLCFQERSDYAVYVDAHIIEVQRRLHDIKGCRCIFVIRYDDDGIEEKVQLNRICCRP